MSVQSDICLNLEGKDRMNWEGKDRMNWEGKDRRNWEGSPSPQYVREEGVVMGNVYIMYIS